MKWGWLLAIGLIMVTGGTAGIVLAFYLTLAGVILFGVLALTAGGFQLWHAFAVSDAKWSGRALLFLVGVLYLVLGGLVVWDPIGGSISLTLLLVAFLLALGISRVVYAWKCRRRGWRWKLSFIGGLINLLLAGLILYGWPATAFWVIGLFVAFELIIGGWLLVATALAVRRFEKEKGISMGVAL